MKPSCSGQPFCLATEKKKMRREKKKKIILKVGEEKQKSPIFLELKFFQ